MRRSYEPVRIALPQVLCDLEHLLPQRFVGRADIGGGFQAPALLFEQVVLQAHLLLVGLQALQLALQSHELGAAGVEPCLQLCVLGFQVSDSRSQAEQLGVVVLAVARPDPAGRGRPVALVCEEDLLTDGLRAEVGHHRMGMLGW